MSYAPVEHWMDHHQGLEWRFSMEVVQTFETPLQRQATEGYRISNYKGDIVVNRKGEWGCNMPPQLHVEDPSVQSQKPESNQSKARKSNGGAGALPPPKKRKKLDEDPENHE